MASRSRTVLAAFTVAAAVLAPAAPAPAAGTSEWLQAGHDSSYSYYNAGESVLNAGTVKSVKPRWQITPAATTCPGYNIVLGPVVAGGLTLTQDTSGLSARDSRTGRQVWKTDLHIENRWARNLVVAGKRVIVTASGTPCGTDGGTSGGSLQAFNLATGAHLWSASDDTEAQQAVVTGGMLVIGGSSSGVESIVSGYRLTDGRRIWSDGTNSDGARTLASLIPVNHEVLVNRFHQETVRLDPATGKQTGDWPQTWSPLSSTPAGDRVFVADSANRTVKAVRASDRKVLWSVSRVSHLAATDGRRLYLAAGSNIEAFDVSTGKPRWTVALDARAGQPVRAGGLLYVPVAGKPVAVHDAATGAKVATSAALSPVRQVLAVAAGQLYASSAPNRTRKVIVLAAARAFPLPT